MTARSVAGLAIVVSTVVTAGGLAPAHGQGDAKLLAQRGGARRGGGGAASNITIGRVLAEGVVDSIESSTGRVTIKTDGGTVESVFPPRVLSSLKSGDVVFVTVNLVDPRAAAVTGSIAALDRAQGTVTVTTPGGPLTLKPSADALAQMKVGDPLLLKLELVDIGPPSDVEKKN